MNWRLIGWIWTAVELLTAATSWAGGCYPARSYNYGYYRQPSYYYPQVQVVNQLVGIPVPVAYKANIAEQGKTLYTYQSHQFSKPIDLSLYFTQAGRLSDQISTLQQQIIEGANSNAQLVIEGSTAIAEINAKRDAAVATLKAAEATGDALRLRLQTQTHQHGQTVEVAPPPGDQPGTAPGGGFPPNGGQPPPPANGGDIVTILQTKCLTCHTGTRVKRDDGEVVETEHLIDLSKYVALRPELKAIVKDRIYSDDPEVRMPPNGRLSRQEFEAFFRN